MVFNKKENTIDFNSLNIRLNFNNEDQSDPLKIKKTLVLLILLVKFLS